ncbi:hypothetical protein TRFO_14549 [Tritrichomonas foetus]|uniref:Uncharacterized protein n=1 Tax=Tritrichomonas foetus TaxID=1144522 RepID=A0A1J4KZ99_9EUKA|nr:hypothetical protein TRFO_14549 [Tritrichomonas foetus]|eukprot:OHT15038.1 hypothetical protein TRFO_14549 [Tritrichomonas foetus]
MNDSNDSNDHVIGDVSQKKSYGMWIGIAVGLAMALAIIILIVILFKKMKENQSKFADDEAENEFQSYEITSIGSYSSTNSTILTIDNPLASINDNSSDPFAEDYFEGLV